VKSGEDHVREGKVDVRRGHHGVREWQRRDLLGTGDRTHRDVVE